MGRIKTAQKPASAGVEQDRRKTLPQLFKPGQSGNPAGRKPGSRNKLTENILSDLAEFYEKEGRDLIRRVQDENPAALLQGLLKLIPKESHIEISAGTVLSLTADQRTRIAEEWLISQMENDPIEGEAIRIETKRIKAR